MYKLYFVSITRIFFCQSQNFQCNSISQSFDTYALVKSHYLNSFKSCILY